MTDVVVLAGHGSRSDEANAALVSLADALSRDLGTSVYPAYLEMAQPSIPAALRAARDAGAKRIVLVPYFLSPGMHVKRDLVAIAETAREELGLPVDIAQFLGAHPAIVGLLAEIALNSRT